MEQVEITSENFSQYFRDAASSRPQPGECLAIFRAVAEFVDGNLKQDVVDKLINNKFGCQTAIQLLIKHAGMNYKEALRIVKEVNKDLLELTKEEVIDKAYKFTFENRYFTKKEYVPDSPNWQTIGLKMADNDSFKLEYKDSK